MKAGGKYTVIPHRAVAHISCRLVPGQEPDAVVAALQTHCAAITLPGVDIELNVDPAHSRAYTIDADHPAISAAKAALASVYPDQEVLLAKIAGTLPPVTLFEEFLGAKTLFFSFSTADERLHAPNEYMRIRRLREGMLAWEQLWRLLAAGPYRLQPLAQRESRISDGE